jgi:hypothetical protein
MAAPRRASLSKFPQIEKVSLRRFSLYTANLPGNALVEAVVTRADGFYYENQALNFDPAHHHTRTDFDEPYRMFACPVCCD